ncbi:MAG: aspartate aminotransferase family protein [Acidobacteria bacterium]|nr:aspartate aminotransferase family protein [Acidobacteriota bacterium]
MKKDVREIEKKFLMQTYARFPLILERGKGCWVWDTKGKKYLDFVSGLGVNALGHSHPRILKALREQAGKVIHVSNLYYHPYQGPLAAALAKITGMDRVFFCNSGTEAVEGAIKLARLYASRRGKKKFEVVALKNSFHGRTFGALSATGQEKYRKEFEPLVPGFRFARYNDVEHLESCITENTCAVLVEPIQGEGGIFEMSQEFMEAAASLARRNHAVLICDEIQCGLGRTGDYLASKHYRVRPDIVLLAKPLGGGLPLGAFLAREEIGALFQPGMHGSTFGGGPLACRVALEFLAVLEKEKVLKNVRKTGEYFRRRLLEMAAKYPFIREVRGRGLMLAIDLAIPSRPFVQMAMDRGFIINSTHDTVLRFLPPLIVEKKHVDALCKMLDEIFANTPWEPAGKSV